MKRVWLIIVTAILFVGLVAYKVRANEDYVGYTQAIERQYGLTPNLLVSICSTESGWRNLKGAKGEIGICQLNPASVRAAFGPVRISKHPQLSFGSTGIYVKQVQGLLQTRQDGVYGMITKGLVLEYQVAHNLRVDGIVGPQTWQSLVGPTSYVELLWNPHMNIEYAAKYLVWLKQRLRTENDLIITAAYNGGPANSIVRYLLLVEQKRGKYEKIPVASLDVGQSYYRGWRTVFSNSSWTR